MGRGRSVTVSDILYADFSDSTPLIIMPIAWFSSRVESFQKFNDIAKCTVEMF